jgi:hypothetical protein
MEIVPFVAIGELRFGETRQAIRQRLGGNSQSFSKSEGENETDAYDELGLHLYFDNEDRLEFVEAFEPAIPTFQGFVLLGRDLDEVEIELSAIGYGSVRDDVGLKFDGAGIALFAPARVVEGIAVFRRGYYDT